MQRAFAVFDRDGSGSVTINELGEVLQQLHPDLKPTKEEIEKIMRLMDQNGDGQINLDEFLSTMETWFVQEQDNSSSGKRKRDNQDVRWKKSNFLEQRKYSKKSKKIFFTIFGFSTSLFTFF